MSVDAPALAAADIGAVGQGVQDTGSMSEQDAQGAAAGNAAQGATASACTSPNLVPGRLLAGDRGNSSRRLRPPSAFVRLMPRRPGDPPAQS